MTSIEKLWYDLIVAGEKTIEECPRRIKDTVKAELIKNGHITEEIIE